MTGGVVLSCCTIDRRFFFLFKGLIHKFVGDRKSRLMKRLSPSIAEVKEWADRAKGITDEDFPARTSDLVERLQGKTGLAVKG